MMLSKSSCLLKKVYRIFLLIILFLSSPPLQGYALEVNTWDGPYNLSDSPGNSISASLVADKSGVVHLIWVEEESDIENIILYTHLVDGVWSPPVDIVAESNFGVGGARLASDYLGNLHLIWQGAGGIKYSHVYAPEANGVQNWSTAVVIVPSQNNMSDFDLSINGNEIGITVCITYAIEIGLNSGVYSVCSADGGSSWNEPIKVYENFDNTKRVTNPRIIIGQNGIVHAIWVVSNYPETFPPIGLMHARSMNNGATWENASLLASGPYDDPAIITRDKEEVHVVWSGTADDRYKFHRFSPDNGQTWFPVWRNDEVGGLAGRPALAADSQARLHWLSIGDLFNLQGSAPKDVLYYARYENNLWEKLGQVFRDEVREQNMANVSAAISLGNHLHVAVQTPVQRPSGGYQFDIFYFNRFLDGPSLSPQFLPTPVKVVPTPTILSVTEPIATQVADNTVLKTQPASNPPIVLQNPSVPIVAGVIPIIIIFIGIILFKNLLKDR